MPEALALARRRSRLGAAPALVMLAIAIADCGRFADTDLWGHLLFGSMLLHRGPYLGPDLFSYAPHVAHWLHHEWLSEALMAWIYAAAGIMGLKLWKLACTAVTVGLIAMAAGESAAPLGLQFTVLLSTAFALIPYMQFRPLLFSYAFTAATVVLLTRDNYRGRAPLWIAVPGLALWSNLHGSFFIGLGLLGAYTAVRGLTDMVTGRGAGRLLRLYRHAWGRCGESGDAVRNRFMARRRDFDPQSDDTASDGRLAAIAIRSERADAAAPRRDNLSLVRTWPDGIDCTDGRADPAP